MVDFGEDLGGNVGRFRRSFQKVLGKKNSQQLIFKTFKTDLPHTRTQLFKRGVVCFVFSNRVVGGEILSKDSVKGWKVQDGPHVAVKRPGYAWQMASRRTAGTSP